MNVTAVMTTSPCEKKVQMTLQEINDLMDSGEKTCFCVWTQEGHIRVGVNRSCIETTLGHFPRRLDFPDQDRFHDAYYSWVSRAKSLATEMLTNFSTKNGLSSEVEVDAWDKPTLRIK
jgi:hypothetical protein